MVEESVRVQKMERAHTCISTIGHNASIDMDLPENFDRKTRIIVLSVHQPGAKKGMVCFNGYERLALEFFSRYP